MNKFNIKGFWMMILFPASLHLLVGCGSDSAPSPEPILGPDSNILVETLTISGTFMGDDGISIDNDGSVYVSHLANAAGTTIYKVTSDGTSTIFASNLTAPMGHTINEDNSLYVAFNGPTIIGEITSDGTFSTWIEDSRFRN